MVFVFGDIGSGKSALCADFARLGANVISSDEIVAELYLQDEGMVRDVESALKVSVRDVEGNVDKRRIAEAIFVDPSARALVEAVVHPRVARALRERLMESKSLVTVYEVSALKRTSDTSSADVLVRVVADDDIRLERLMSRGMTRTDARKRMASQAEDSTRMDVQDVTVSNNGTREELFREAERLMAAWSHARD